MWKRFLALLLVLLAFGVPALAQQPAADETTVYTIPLTGTVEKGLTRYLERSFGEAEASGADAVILELNTTGGMVASATDIRQIIGNAPMPVYAYVRYNAISAGAFLALACDALYMAPGSTIGAAELVNLTGGEVDEKSFSYWEAEMRSVAEQQGKDPEVAAAMVRRDMVIEGLVREGELLTLTTQEAEEIGFTDGVFNTRGELLEHLGLAGATETTVPQTPAESLARLITDPAVATLLIAIGLAALVIEVMTAGFGVAGLISILSFTLFFGGHVVTGLAGREVIFMFVIGIILLLVEAFIPNFGVLGLSGLAAIVASIVLSAATTGQGVRMMAMAMVLAGLIIFIAFHFLKRTGLWSQIILQYAETKDLGYVGPGDSSHLVGKEGTTLTPLRPAGVAEIEGKRVDVVSEGGFIAQSTLVTVVATEGTRVVVRPQ
ncbi:MAG: NfeD family protein [Bacillota bacterium]|nr:NfeD family protein [Bacillota bacterium]MDW7683473.1 NfeD family protein [Bacillota bacterium]